MTPIETDESPRDGVQSTIERAKDWLAVPANVTRGWLLLSIFLGFVFTGCAVYAAVETIKLDNRVTQEQVAESLAQQVATCVNTNQRRAEAAEIALLDIEADQQALANDRENWDAIDELFPSGIPEPARSIIYSGLDERMLHTEIRLAKVEATYTATDCTAIGTVVTDPNITPTGD